MLRAIDVHLPVLRQVYCICSNESLPQARSFWQILKNYGVFNSQRQFWIVSSAGQCLAPDTECHDAGYDFEDFDGLASGLRSLLDNLRRQGVRDRSIMVDFTGGQKVTSAVAIAETFDLDVSAQYVQTRPPKDVFSYDVVLAKVRLDVPVK
jgi:hypothetical protein